MLASTTIFYANDWPKRLMIKFKMIKENYEDLSPETIAADEERLFKQNVSKI